VTSDWTPLVRLVPYAAHAGPRQLGALAGQMMEADDCWAPDLETEALLYGGALEPPTPRRVAEKTEEPSADTDAS